MCRARSPVWLTLACLSLSLSLLLLSGRSGVQMGGRRCGHRERGTNRAEGDGSDCSGQGEMEGKTRQVSEENRREKCLALGRRFPGSLAPTPPLLWMRSAISSNSNLIPIGDWRARVAAAQANVRQTEGDAPL